MSLNPDVAYECWPSCAAAMAESRPHFVWLLLGLLLLGGCASQLPLPSEQPRLQLPLQLHLQQHSAAGSQDQLLVIQQDQQALRWTLLSPLGTPLARQLLVDGRWQADGLLPPNPEAHELFAALLFALTPDDQLERLYAGRDWTRQTGTRRLNGTPHWHVRYQHNGRFQLDVGNGLSYGVAPLDDGARRQ